jgi:hypothetical protein
MSIWERNILRQQYRVISKQLSASSGETPFSSNELYLSSNLLITLPQEKHLTGNNIIYKKIKKKIILFNQFNLWN